MEVNKITGAVVDSAMKVHSVLGPGLLESAYKTCLAYELRKRGFNVSCEIPVPIVYETIRLDAGYRMDMLVESEVVVEVKAIAKLLPVHEAQLLSHLKLSDHHVGLLINFHVRRLKDGITRMVNRSWIAAVLRVLCVLCVLRGKRHTSLSRVPRQRQIHDPPHQRIVLQSTLSRRTREFTLLLEVAIRIHLDHIDLA